MKISTSHKQFTDEIARFDAIEFPEKILGSNWKTVINFWLFIETLSLEQWEIVGKRLDVAYKLAGPNVRGRNWTAAIQTSGLNVRDFSGIISIGDWKAPQNWHYAIVETTCELIGLPILLKERNSLFFVPIFDSL